MSRSWNSIFRSGIIRYAFLTRRTLNQFMCSVEKRAGKRSNERRRWQGCWWRASCTLTTNFLQVYPSTVLILLVRTLQRLAVLRAGALVGWRKRGCDEGRQNDFSIFLTKAPSSKAISLTWRTLLEWSGCFWNMPHACSKHSWDPQPNNRGSKFNHGCDDNATESEVDSGNNGSIKRPAAASLWLGLKWVKAVMRSLWMWQTVPLPLFLCTAP